MIVAVTALLFSIIMNDTVDAVDAVDAVANSYVARMRALVDDESKSMELDVNV